MDELGKATFLARFPCFVGTGFERAFNSKSQYTYTIHDVFMIKTEILGPDSQIPPDIKTSNIKDPSRDDPRLSWSTGVTELLGPSTFWPGLGSPGERRNTSQLSGRVKLSHWSRSVQILCSDWTIVSLRQLSYAAKSQLKAPKALN